jgi:hypothetical protein
VANHTSPIDVLILACDNAYALSGQLHGGFMGFFQHMLAKAAHHIWFERGEGKDRQVVVTRLLSVTTDFWDDVRKCFRKAHTTSGSKDKRQKTEANLDRG